MGNDLDITPIPALKDNYIWAACKGPNALVVDPGEATPVLDFIHRNGLKLRAIFITHMHMDHTDGVEELMSSSPKAMLYEPKGEGYEPKDIVLGDGDEARPHFFDMTFSVISTPGHTQEHVSYHGNGLLFCGDALFSCGCGRLFDGDEYDLATSIGKIEALDDDLLVCCGHEYTMANIEFALQVEPGNKDLAAWRDKAQKLRDAGKPTLPTRLGEERRYNPYLRAGVDTVIKAASEHAGRKLESKTEVLGELRNWKDSL